MINKKTKVMKYAKKGKSEASFYTKVLNDSPIFEKLTAKQRLFVVNFCLCNGDRDLAMELCGYKVASRDSVAAKFMQNEEIQKAIYEFWNIIFGDKLELITHKMLDQLYRRAFSKRSKYFTAYGELKEGLSFDDLGEDECLIDGIERKYYGKSAEVEVIVYKIADRNQAYSQLMKMTGMDITRMNVTTEAQTTGVLEVLPTVSKAEWGK